MSTELAPITDQEQKAIITTCILAGFADGAQSDVERQEIKRIVDSFSNEPFNFTAVYQQALTGKLPLAEVARGIQSPNAKSLAYEMAVCICLVDGAISAEEQQFLGQLRDVLNLDPGVTASFQQNATALSAEPGGPPPILSEANPREVELEKLILNRSIIAGALELMPQTLATMAIVPLQMHLVYQIGAIHGVKLDRGHIKEFLAAAGIGVTSQVVEGYLSRFVNKVTKRFVGRLFAAIATQVTESSFAFATTYAVGQAAKTYYAGGRSLSPAQLRDVFTTGVRKANSLKPQYAADIAARAAQMKVTDILPLVNSLKAAA